MTTPRIIFAGTPDFAAQHLKALLDTPYEIVAVYTQPDRPAGRGHKLTPSPVKSLALEHGLPVYTPLNFKDPAAVEQFTALKADLAIIVAYGLLLPTPILEAPRLGCINIHASLLPQWRGAAPIQRALLSGQATTGVTIMQLVLELDAGDILRTQELPILPEDTSGSLFERLATCGADALVKFLPDLFAGKITPVAQDPQAVTYAAKLSKSESPLDFTKSAAELALQVRGLNPWPIATTSLHDVTYKVFQASALSNAEIEQLHLPVIADSAAASDSTAANAASNTAGTIAAISAQGIVVTCGSGYLCLRTIQAPGKGRVDAAALARSKADIFTVGAHFA